MVTRVKICGLTRQADAELAIELGAHAIGMVREPSSSRYMSSVPDWWRELAPYAVRVAVYGPFIAEMHADAFDRFQAHEFSDGGPSTFRSISTLNRIPSTGDVLPEASAYLLDAFSPDAYGGTGKTVDWPKAAEFVAWSPRPVILAGGLTPENVRDAIDIVRPWAVDVCSGVEVSPGVKDSSKLKAFLDACRA